MMTKDKKPFTYTPGGIDFLAEIRSPRMQRRISKNAADEGVAHHHQQPHQPSGQPQQQSGPAQLTPQALMAMQPQMAVPVFPPMPQQMPVLHSSALSPPPPPPPPQHNEPLVPSPAAIRANLRPAIPNFSSGIGSSSSNNSSPHEAFQEVINSLSTPKNPEPQNPVHQPSSSPVSAPAPFVERRNAQLGSIYIPPVSSSATGPSPSATNSSTPSVSSPMAQVARTPMPWMNSQNRTPTSPTPHFVQQLQQERGTLMVCNA